MIRNLFDFENDSNQKAATLTVIKTWMTDVITYGLLWHVRIC